MADILQELWFPSHLEGGQMAEELDVAAAWTLAEQDMPLPVKTLISEDERSRIL